jgi:D-xylose transport system substrate-binding protein
VDYDIQNAQNDKQAFQTIADQMITGGATVLLIVNLDSGTGKAVIDKAKAQGVGVIDYDRLTLNGGASYYVSFDNEAVGKLQGEGLVQVPGPTMGGEEPGLGRTQRSPTDNNATPVQERLPTRCSSPSTTRRSTPRARTSRCRSGTTPPPGPSSSR